MFAAYGAVGPGGGACDQRPGTSAGDGGADALSAPRWLANSSYVPAADKGQAEPIVVDSSSGGDASDSSGGSSVQLVEDRREPRGDRGRKAKKRASGRRTGDKAADAKRGGGGGATRARPAPPRLPAARPKWWFCAAGERYPEIAVDRHRDLDNFQYGELYARHRAKYGYGNTAEFLRRTGQRRVAALFGRKDAAAAARKRRYFYGKNVRRLLAGVPKERTSTQQKKWDELKDYVQLVGSKVLGDDNEELVWDESIQMYRRLDQKSECGGPKAAAGNADVEPAPDAPAAVRAAYMNGRLRAEPGDVRTWLAFVRIQDALHVRNNVDKDQADAKGGKLTKSALAERKLSILDRALAANPTSVALAVHRLQLAAAHDVLDRKAVEQAWKRIEFASPNSLLAWASQIEFYRSTFATFSVDRQVSLYDRCIGKLLHVLSGHMRTHRAEPGTADFLLDVFLQRCALLFDAGWSEKAWASLQAIVEYNFFAPPLAKAAAEADKRAMFEEFWSSDCPLFGEPAADGWLNWSPDDDGSAGGDTSSHMDDVQRRLDQCEDDIVADDAIACGARWAAVETARVGAHWAPVRKADDSLEDADRTILFDDVKAALITVERPVACARLLFACLSFAGVHLPDSVRCLADNHSCTSERDLDDIWRAFDLLPRGALADAGDPAAARGPRVVDDIGERVLDMAEAIWAHDGHMSALVQCVRVHDARVRLAQSQSGKDVAKAFRRRAKSILADGADVESSAHALLVYVQYATELAALGAHNAAVHSLRAALSQPAGVRPLRSAASLHATVAMATIWLDADDAPPDELGALLAGVIVGGDGEGESAGTMLVRARRAVANEIADCDAEEPARGYADNLSAALSAGSLHSVLDAATYSADLPIMLCAVRDVLAAASSRSPRLDVSHMERLSAALLGAAQALPDAARVHRALLTGAAERVACFMIRLLRWHHRRHVLARPAELKAHLLSAATRFPRSAALSRSLVAHLCAGLDWLQLGAHLARAVSKAGDNDDCAALVAACAGVQASLIRADMACGGAPEAEKTDRLVRGLQAATQRLPSAWKLWLVWLNVIAGRHAEPPAGGGAARLLYLPERVYTEALRSCPSVKRLYVAAVRCCAGDEGKVRRLVDVLVEKQIRLRAPLEEVEMLRQAVVAKRNSDSCGETRVDTENCQNVDGDSDVMVS